MREDGDLSVRRGQSGDFVLESIRETTEQTRSTREDDVIKQVLADISITLHDRIEGDFVDSVGTTSTERRLEEDLSATKALRVEGDGLLVRKDK